MSFPQLRMGFRTTIAQTLIIKVLFISARCLQGPFPRPAVLRWDLRHREGGARQGAKGDRRQVQVTLNTEVSLFIFFYSESLLINTHLGWGRNWLWKKSFLMLVNPLSKWKFLTSVFEVCLGETRPK